MPKKKKSFRLAHVSDTHIRNLKYHDDYRACFEQMYNILREEKPDYIVHCGEAVPAGMMIGQLHVRVRHTTT